MKFRLLVLAIVLGLMSVIPVRADLVQITLAAVDSGQYTSGGFHNTSSQNYLAGISQFQVVFRNFFIFDLSGITDSIIGAELRAYNPSGSVVGDSGDGYISLNPTETYEIFSVSTDISVLTGGTGGPGAFNDLGSGTNYGSRTFSSLDNGTIVSIALNANALADLNAASGLFVLGGAVTSLAFGQGLEHVFAFTAGPTGGTTVSDLTRELVITVEEDTPPPDTTILLGEFSTTQSGSGSAQLDDVLGVSFFLTYNPEAFVPSDCVGCATIFPLNDVPDFFDFNASNTSGFSNFLLRLQDTTDDTLLSFTVLNDTLFSGQGGGSGGLESFRLGSSLSVIRDAEISFIRLIVNDFEVADTETGHTRSSNVTWQFWGTPAPDTTPPQTTITTGPSGTITRSSATFTFTGSDDVTPIGNLVYASQLVPLESSFTTFSNSKSRTFPNLTPGNYAFFVKARDEARIEDPSPATRSFTVIGKTLVANFMNGNDALFNSRIYFWNPSDISAPITVRVFTLPLTGASTLLGTVDLGTLEASSSRIIKLAEDILTPLATLMPYTDNGGNLTLEFTIVGENVRGVAQVFSSNLAFGTYPLQEIPSTPNTSPTVLVANFLNGNNEALNSRVYLWNPSDSSAAISARVFTLLQDGPSTLLGTVDLGFLEAESARNIKIAEDVLFALDIPTPYTDNGGNVTVEFTVDAENVVGVAQVFSSNLAFGTYPMQAIP